MQKVPLLTHTQAIDDNEISCDMPIESDAEAVGSDADSCYFFIQVVKHSRIASSIARKLTSVKACRKPLETLILRVKAFQTELNDWYQSLRPSYQFSVRLSRRQRGNLPNRPHVHHRIYLFNAYYGSLIAIHSVFSYPWRRPGQGMCTNTEIQEQTVVSTRKVVEASRELVLVLRAIDTEGAWPAWYCSHFFPYSPKHLH